MVIQQMLQRDIKNRWKLEHLLRSTWLTRDDELNSRLQIAFKTNESDIVSTLDMETTMEHVKLASSDESYVQAPKRQRLG